ncbi:MAG: hypothetical protein R3B99_30680 [Polyangiales bacterium]
MSRSFFVVLALFVGVGCATDSLGPVGSSVLEVRQSTACGGFAGLLCPDGYACVDDPRDDCDPDRGGADCMGICKRQGGNNGGNECRGRDHADRNYVSRDTAQCAAIRFLCAEGYQPFFDACGCGCEPMPGESCGDNVCGDGEYCCNASCGVCAAEGGVCTQQVCSPTF